MKKLFAVLLKLGKIDHYSIKIKIYRKNDQNSSNHINISFKNYLSDYYCIRYDLDSNLYDLDDNEHGKIYINLISEIRMIKHLKKYFGD